MWPKVGPTGWILFILEVLQLIWIFVCRHSYIFKCIFGINKAEWNRNYASHLFIMENPQKTWIYSGTVAFKSIVCLRSRSLHGYFFTARAWTPALTHSLMFLISEATAGDFLLVFLLWVSPCMPQDVFTHPSGHSFSIVFHCKSFLFSSHIVVLEIGLCFHSPVIYVLHWIK